MIFYTFFQLICILVSIIVYAILKDRGIVITVFFFLYIFYSLQIYTYLCCFLYRMFHASMDQKMELVFVFKKILSMIWYDYKYFLDEIAWTCHQVGLAVIFQSFFNRSYIWKFKYPRTLGLECHNDVFSLRTTNFIDTTVGFQLYSPIKVISVHW